MCNLSPLTPLIKIAVLQSQELEFLKDTGFKYNYVIRL